MGRGGGGISEEEGGGVFVVAAGKFWKPVLTGQGSLDCSMYSENSFPVNQARSGHG